MVVVERKNMDMLKIALDAFRAGLGWKELHELKFNTTEKVIIKNLLKFIKQFDFEAYAVVIDKSKIIEKPKLSSGETIYNYVIKELLIRLEINEPSIVIDGVSHKKHAEHVRTYLRKALREHGINKSKINQKIKTNL